MVRLSEGRGEEKGRWWFETRFSTRCSGWNGSTYVPCSRDRAIVRVDSETEFRFNALSSRVIILSHTLTRYSFKSWTDFNTAGCTMHVHTLLFHNLDHGWKIGFRNESEKRETKRRSFRKESKSDYYNTNIPSNGEIARPNACRRSHSTRPPRRKRSRSTASRHATKPNAAANRHYPRNNQPPGGGRETPNAAEGGGTTLFSLAPRCISYFFSFFFLSLSLLLLLFVRSFSLQSRSFISRTFDYRNFFVVLPYDFY